MPRRKQPTPHEAQRALTAIKAGAEHHEAAAYAGADNALWDSWLAGPFGDQVAEAENELALYARTVIRGAVPSQPALARDLLDRQAGRRNIQRLRAITHPR